MTTKQAYSGLNDAEVKASREKHGANILTPVGKEPLWEKFLDKFADPLIIILLIAGTLSIGISCYEYFTLPGHGLSVFFEPLGIFIAVLLATGTSFVFELKADQEFSLLNQVNDDEPVEVIRNGVHTSIPRKEVVVGDIVVFNTGEEVAADGELLSATSLKVDESALTGEPICEKSTNENDFDANATFPTNHAMKGSKVMEGHGIMRVFAVGDHTESGKVYKATQIDDSTKTPLNEQLDGLGELITKASYAFAALIIIGKLLVYFHFALPSFLITLPTAVFFYLIVKKFDQWSRKAIAASIAGYVVVFLTLTVWLHELLIPEAELSALMAYTLNTLMIAVTLIVVAVPEGLPMAVSLSLAYSMRRMLKNNNLVRKMHACETMGATTVICTDKTGTLTQNKMQVNQFYFCNGQPDVRPLVYEDVAVNSTASLDNSGKVLGNPTEGALLLWLNGQPDAAPYEDYRNAKVLDEIPFNTEHKYMATRVESRVKEGQELLYMKGAPEIVMDKCPNLAPDERERMNAFLKDSQQKGMRTLAFAYKADNTPGLDDLTMLGIAAIADPVREEVPDAVKECQAAGIKVIVVTGDTAVTAKEIARQSGIWTDDDDQCDDGIRRIYTGQEIQEMPWEELKATVKQVKIVCRARPMDKKRLVKALVENREVVAVTGDGTNDAPALKSAHVGLSMGDGTSVAKEASDITIVDNSFSSIGKAVMWGRSLYQNIQRFILFQMTVNVAACLIVLIGAFVGTQSPLTVTQMLWVNLIMDTFAAMALASLPPNGNVMRAQPRNREDFIINKEMKKRIIGVGIVFTAILFSLVYVFNRYDITCMTDLLNPIVGGTGMSEKELSLFFCLFVFLQFWNMFNAKAFMTGKSAFHHLGECKGFLFISTIILIGQVLIVNFGGEMFNVTRLQATDWLLLLAGTLPVLLLPEIARITKELTKRQDNH